MPTKKNQTPNAFFFFMQSLRPQLQREGVVLENGNRSLAELAGPRWAEMSAEEREPFAEIAKQHKINKKFGVQQGDSDKMDCTRQLISKRVDTVTLNEQRRRKERKQVIESWTGKDACLERFFMIAFMSLCDMPDDKYMPCEIAVAEFSLRHGIQRLFHKFIKPGTIPLGYRYQAMKQSETTHQIPPEGLASDEWNVIYDELLKFLNPRKLSASAYPPVYCKSSETKLTEFSLEWLASKAGSSNKIKKVYELEGLVCDLHAESRNAEEKIAPSKHQATELLSTTVFDYETGSRCKWHEEKEVRYCAAGTVKRYCYCLSDFLCAAFGIEMTSNHLPERPDGESCTVVTPKLPDSYDRGAAGFQEKTDSQEKQNTDYFSQGYRDNSYASGVKKKQYARRGPTYDEESLRSSCESNVTPRANTPTTVPTGLSSLGRGRGRGRAIPTQPLRRPNLPGVAARGVEEAVRLEASGETNLESPWEGSLGAGRGKGRGVRPPNTTPKVWAGDASAPHPSTAPLPPTAWQHDVGQLPSSNTASYPWVLQQPNGNVNPNIPSWAMIGEPNQGPFRMENYTSCSGANMRIMQHPDGKENSVTNVQEDLQNFSLFDKDYYDY